MSLQRLSIFLVKEMAAHSSILAWRIPWTGEPGGLHSMGSWKVRQDWVKSAHAPYILISCSAPQSPAVV